MSRAYHWLYTLAQQSLRAMDSDDANRHEETHRRSETRSPGWPNHAVEANRRPAAPLEANSPSGGGFCARPLSLAAAAHLCRSAPGWGQMEARLQSQRPPPSQMSDGFGCRPPRSEPPSASLASQRCRHAILHHRGTKITEGAGHSTADLGPRLRDGVRVPHRGGDGGWVEITEWTLGSNHAVEANRRPAGPFDVGSQFGSRFCARPRLPAAVASPRRSA